MPAIPGQAEQALHGGSTIGGEIDLHTPVEGLDIDWNSFETATVEEFSILAESWKYAAMEMAVGIPEAGILPTPTSSITRMSDREPEAPWNDSEVFRTPSPTVPLPPGGQTCTSEEDEKLADTSDELDFSVYLLNDFDSPPISPKEPTPVTETDGQYSVAEKRTNSANPDNGNGPFLDSIWSSGEDQEDSQQNASQDEVFSAEPQAEKAAGQNGSSLGSHLGDLLLANAMRQSFRKHTKQNKLVVNPRQKRKYKGDGIDDGSENERDDGELVHSEGDEGMKQLQRPLSPHITPTADMLLSTTQQLGANKVLVPCGNITQSLTAQYSMCQPDVDRKFIMPTEDLLPPARPLMPRPSYQPRQRYQPSNAQPPANVSKERTSNKAANEEAANVFEGRIAKLFPQNSLDAGARPIKRIKESHTSVPCSLAQKQAHQRQALRKQASLRALPPQQKSARSPLQLFPPPRVQPSVKQNANRASLRSSPTRVVGPPGPLASEADNGPDRRQLKELNRTTHGYHPAGYSPQGPPQGYQPQQASETPEARRQIHENYDRYVQQNGRRKTPKSPKPRTRKRPAEVVGNDGKVIKRKQRMATKARGMVFGGRSQEKLWEEQQELFAEAELRADEERAARLMDAIEQEEAKLGAEQNEKEEGLGQPEATEEIAEQLGSQIAQLKAKAEQEARRKREQNEQDEADYRAKEERAAWERELANDGDRQKELSEDEDFLNTIEDDEA